VISATPSLMTAVSSTNTQSGWASSAATVSMVTPLAASADT
jgi:hypothetical protein